MAQRSVIELGMAPHAAEAIQNWRATPRERFTAIRASSPVASGEPVRLFLSLDRRADSVLLLGYVRATLVGVPVLLFVVALGAWLIARTGLQPLRLFHHLAASIGTQSLGQRVSAVGLPGELAGLAEEFNGMLDRIHLGYQRLQEFSGDLAHEMRTPIATLLGRTQVDGAQMGTTASWVR